MKIEAVSNIQMGAIERDRNQEALKNSLCQMQMQSGGIYNQEAIDLALKRARFKEQEIASRVNRLKVYLDKNRNLD